MCYIFAAFPVNAQLRDSACPVFFFPVLDTADHRGHRLARFAILLRE